MSKIQVDAIEQQTACGTTLTAGGGAGKTVVVDATTVTLGRCGGTVALASGASQTGFGRTGTVDWQTTPKTATFSAVSGEGYFCNTTAGAFTVNLPAGVAGAIVSLADYAGTWQTNGLTISPNGTDKIGGANASVSLLTEGQSVTFVFIDSTQGWINTMDSTSNVRASNFIEATGGTITTSGDFKIHTFTGPSTFNVTAGGSPAGSNTVDYLVVAGGGGTESNGGGGGGGGFRMSNSLSLPAPTTSPLASPTAVPVAAIGYPITVGAAGTAGTVQGSPRASTNGNNSIFSSITSTGGGASSSPANAPTNPAGNPGGSGGGASATQGAGNTPPTSPPQGNPGGPPGCSPSAFSSGGGAGGAGTSAAPQVGGVGSYVSPSFAVSCAGTTGPVPAVRYFAGGGGGANQGPTQGSTHAGGAGGGGTGGSVNTTNNTAGATNTGGGGGSGNGGPASGAAGGSGIVIIRYKFQ